MGVLDRFLSSKQDDKQEIWDLFDAGKNLMESHFMTVHQWSSTKLFPSTKNSRQN